MTFDPRITIVTLGVTDINRSVDFYQKLGFKRSSDSNDQVAFFKLRGTVLGLFGREALAKDAGVDYSEAAFSGVTLAHNRALVNAGILVGTGVLGQVVDIHRRLVDTDVSIADTNHDPAGIHRVNNT